MNLRTLFISFGFLLMTLTLATSADNAFSSSDTTGAVAAAKTRFCPNGQFAVRTTASAAATCVSKPVFEQRQQALKELRSNGAMTFDEYKQQSLLTAQTQFEYDAIMKSLQGFSGGSATTGTDTSSGNDENKCSLKACDPGTVLDTDSCTCKKQECTITCSAGYIKDSVNCLCKTEKACSSYGCDNGGIATAVQVGKYMTCQCPTTPPVECTKKSCDPGYAFNMSSCKCEAIAGGSSSSSGGGKCMRPAGTICTQGTVWSESACTCVAGGGDGTDPNCSTQKKLQCQKAGGTLSHVHDTCMCTASTPSGGSGGGSSTGGATTTSTSSGGGSSSSSSSGGKTGSSGSSSSSSSSSGSSSSGAACHLTVAQCKDQNPEYDAVDSNCSCQITSCSINHCKSDEAFVTRSSYIAGTFNLRVDSCECVKTCNFTKSHLVACAANQVWDTDACKCVASKYKNTCAAGTLKDPATGECLPTGNGCEENPITCPAGQYWDGVGSLVYACEHPEIAGGKCAAMCSNMYCFPGRATSVRGKDATGAWTTYCACMYPSHDVVNK